MAAERLLMGKTHEILPMNLEVDFSNREAARAAGVSSATLFNVTRRASEAGIHSYGDVASLPDDELAARLSPDSAAEGAPFPRSEPDCAWIHRDRARPVVTIELLHLEFLEQRSLHGICDRYRAFQKRRGLVVMRQHHVAGDKMSRSCRARPSKTLQRSACCAPIAH